MADSGRNGIYEVDRILKKRVRCGVVEYFIRWRGFSDDWDTWEPITNLSACKGIVIEFEKNNPLNRPVKTGKAKSINMAIRLVKKSKSPKKSVKLNIVKSKSVKIKLMGPLSMGVSRKIKKTSPEKENRIILKAPRPTKNKTLKVNKAAKTVDFDKILKTQIKSKKEISKKCENDKANNKKSENKGRKRKLCNDSDVKTPKKKVKAVCDDDDDDDNVLYSLVEDCKKTKKVASKAVVKPKEIKIVKASSATTTITKDNSQNMDKSKSCIEFCPSPKTSNKRLSLMDGLKTKPIKTVSDKESGPPQVAVSYYTSVKPLMTTPSLLSKAIPSQSMTMESYFADVPSYQMASSIPGSPSSISYKALLENLPQQMHPKKKKKAEIEESEERRTSVRSAECAFRNKDIIVKKCHRYTQIWLNTQTRLKNALNPQVIQEIVTALNSAKYDDSNLVMLSGIGNVFCTGVDLNYLTSGDPKIAARKMSDSLRELVKTFITFPKPIIAVVTGAAIGLGMALLPLCDITYASDKALFYLPFSTLSQTPEGCSSFTLPQVLGLAVGSEILFCGRKLTALEAHQLGLISQVFWPTSMMQEVIPRVQQMAMFTGKALETTKVLIRCHNRTKLELANETECNLLLERWPSPECQRSILAYLDNEKNFIF